MDLGKEIETQGKNERDMEGKEKRKDRCRRQSDRTTARDPVQHRRLNLSVQLGGQCGRSTKTDALMVYDAFQIFGKR